MKKLKHENPKKTFNKLKAKPKARVKSTQTIIKETNKKLKDISKKESEELQTFIYGAALISLVILASILILTVSYT